MPRNVLTFDMPLYCEPVLRRHFSDFCADVSVMQRKRYPYSAKVTFEKQEDMPVFMLTGIKDIDAGVVLSYTDWYNNTGKVQELVDK